MAPSLLCRAVVASCLLAAAAHAGCDRVVAAGEKVRIENGDGDSYCFNASLVPAGMTGFELVRGRPAEALLGLCGGIDTRAPAAGCATQVISDAVEGPSAVFGITGDGTGDAANVALSRNPLVRGAHRPPSAVSH